MTRIATAMSIALTMGLSTPDTHQHPLRNTELPAHHQSLQLCYNF